MCSVSLVTRYNYSYKNNRSSINKKTCNIWGHRKNPENPVQRHARPQLQKHTRSTLQIQIHPTPIATLTNHALLQKYIITLHLCFFTEPWHILTATAHVVQASWANVKPLAPNTTFTAWTAAWCWASAAETWSCGFSVRSRPRAGQRWNLWNYDIISIFTLNHVHYFSLLFRVVFELHVVVWLLGCSRWLLGGCLLAWVKWVHPQVSVIFWSCKYGSGSTFIYVCSTGGAGLAHYPVENKIKFTTNNQQLKMV